MQIDPQQQRWVLAAQSGDRAALDRLLRLIQEPLYGYLAQLLQDRHLAEDVLQETFLLVYRKLYWLREPAAFPAWVYRIASRQAFRAMRQRDRTEISFAEPPSVGRDTDGDGGDEGMDAELMDKIPELIAGLSPASRAVLSLHYQSGLTLEEVASVLSISIGTAKSRLAYGLSRLRERVSCSDTVSSISQTAR